jgi:hypothetical protein
MIAQGTAVRISRAGSKVPAGWPVWSTAHWPWSRQYQSAS